MSVIVTKNPTTGDILRATKNPEIFQIRVEEKRTTYENGFRRTSTRSALINGPEAELREEFFEGQRLPGQILVIESLSPFRTIDAHKDLKVAGTTGIPCTYDDQPIYRSMTYTSNIDTQDVLIQHNNTDQIKLVQSRPAISTYMVASDELLMA